MDRLWYMTGALYLIAYCHTRKDVLLFAIERIRSLTVTDHAYQMPLSFDLESYTQRHKSPHSLSFPRKRESRKKLDSGSSPE